MSSLEQLRHRLAAIPRLSLGHFPTPLVPLSRLSDQMGVELWMKRDELSGLALGGNKTRKLEFILADAIARGYRSIVTMGPLTSNHTMMTAAAARRAGLDVHCVVGGIRPAQPSGNLLLLEYLGADLAFTPCDYAAPTPESTAALRRMCEEVLERTGGYWVPGGGTMPEAEPGYMNAMLEIADQRGGRFDFDHVVLAYGTGSTTTGVLLGIGLGGMTTQVWPVAVMSRHAVEEVWRMPPVAILYRDSVRHFTLPISEDNPPPHELLFGLAEEGYGVPNEASDQAIRTLAQVEGYFLDTVYTAKAFAGLRHLVATGRIPRGSRVLFVHTGGLSMTPAGEKRYASA